MSKLVYYSFWSFYDLIRKNDNRSTWHLKRSPSCKLGLLDKNKMFLNFFFGKWIFWVLGVHSYCLPIFENLKMNYHQVMKGLKEDFFVLFLRTSLYPSNIVECLCCLSLCSRWTKKLKGPSANTCPSVYLSILSPLSVGLSVCVSWVFFLSVLLA